MEEIETMSDVSMGQENLLWQHVEETRKTLGSVAHLDERSDLAIAQFMDRFRVERFDRPDEGQSTWAAYRKYHDAQLKYREAFQDATESSTKNALGAIDPALIGERRIKTTNKIINFIADLFYTFRTYFFGGQVTCLKRRLAFFNGEKAVKTLNKEHQKVLNAAKMFFPNEEFKSVFELDRFLSWIPYAESDLGNLKERRKGLIETLRGVEVELCVDDDGSVILFYDCFDEELA